MGNDTFVTWSQPELKGKKYFILQFSGNHTQPHPQQLLTQRLRGTVQHVDLTQEDVAQKLCDIEALNEAQTRAVLRGAQAGYVDNNSHVEMEEEIFSLVVFSNVTGVLLENFIRMKLRVLIITRENEHLKQDFRYVQWKMVSSMNIFVFRKFFNHLMELKYFDTVIFPITELEFTYIIFECLPELLTLFGILSS